MTATTMPPGTPVVVTGGLLRGARGRVHRPAGWDFAAGIPHYEVDVEGVDMLRTIRADFLRRAA